MKSAIENNRTVETIAFWSAFGGSGLVGLLYWCLSAFRSEVEPIMVTIMYRFGDTDYLPLIYSLAHGQYSEFVDAASYGKRLLPFPVLSMIPYALFVAAFGNIGFVVADALISISSYLLIYAILRSVNENKAMVAAIALAIILAMYDPHNSYAGGWNFRYPRPHVT